MKHIDRNIHFYIPFLCTIIMGVVRSDWSFAQTDVTCSGPIRVKILHHYQKSFPAADLSSLEVSSYATDDTTPNNNIVLDPAKVTTANQRKIILSSLFLDEEGKIDPCTKVLLHERIWKDLLLFCGPPTDPRHHLFASVNRTITELGSCTLALLLATPTHDTAILTSRQRMVKCLLEDPNCLAHIRESLTAYHKVEPALLSFWDSRDPLNARAYVDYMSQHFLFKNPASNKIARKLNSRIFLHNCIGAYGKALEVPLLGLLWCEVHYLMTSVAHGSFLQASRQASYAPFSLFLPGISIFNACSNYLRTDGNRSLLPFLGATITNGLAGWRIYCGVKNYRTYRMVFCNLANRMRVVQHFMQTIQKLNKIVAKHPALETEYKPHLHEIRTLLARSKEKTEVGSMLRNLLDMKFDNWSYYRGNNGKLLATYQLFQEYKQVLQPAMYALGQLDSWSGVAVLMQEAQTNHPMHPYTFATFLDRTMHPTPFLTFDGVWHPLLDPKTVVENTLSLDGKKTRNMIIGGANAGGKSTFLTAVTTSLLLSQTLGLAPARQAILTPFNNICAYLGAEDDIVKGTSLFMTELHRMQQYSDRLAQSKTDEFVFTVIDEPFMGTNPSEAGAAAYSFFAHVAQHMHALHIVSSHHPILMRLAYDFKSAGIANFKAAVEAKAGQKLHYTYKIVPGETTQTVALQLLEQEGYPKELVEQAKRLIKDRSSIYNALYTFKENKSSKTRTCRQLR